MSKFDGIAFDCYGTLLEIQDDRRVTTRMRRQLAKRTILKGGSPLIDDISIRDALLMHGVESRIADEIGIDAAAEADSARPLTGAIEAVEAARSTGMTVVIVSNLSKDYAGAVARWFPDVPTVLSFKMGHAKPDREMFDEARRVLGGGRLLMVGDSRRCDHDGAIACGFSAVMIANKPVPETTSIPSVSALSASLGWSSR